MIAFVDLVQGSATNFSAPMHTESMWHMNFMSRFHSMGYASLEYGHFLRQNVIK